MAVREIDVDDLAEALAGGGRIVDVREPDEYEAGHVPGAVLVPLGTVPDRIDAFRGDGPTYVICKSGGRSMRACELVDAAGQGIEAVNVAGGTMAWITSGRDTVGGESSESSSERTQQLGESSESWSERTQQLGEPSERTTRLGDQPS